MRLLTTFSYLVLLNIAAGTAKQILHTRAVHGGNENSQTSSKPAKDAEILPGRSGWWTDPKTGKTDIHYGDDWMPGHMRHLDRNQAKFPDNKDFMKLQESEGTNRKNALKGIKTSPAHAITKHGLVRDEKMPNMFTNPKHKDQTTVEYRDQRESHGVGRPALDHYKGGRTHSGTDYVSEGGLLNAAKQGMKKTKAQEGRLMSNPGWLPLDPKQRISHESPAKISGAQIKRKTKEAPARIGSPPPERVLQPIKAKEAPGRLAEELLPSNKPKGAREKKKGSRQSSRQKGKGAQENAKQGTSKQGTSKQETSKQETPKPRIGQKRLENPSNTREPPSKAQNSGTGGKKKPPSKTPALGSKRNKPDGEGEMKKSRKDPKPQPKTNLQPGTPKISAEIFRPPPGKKENHFGAPRPERNSDTRHPPRPQNMAAHTKQKAEKEKAQAASDLAGKKTQNAASKAGVVPGSDKAKAKDDKYQKNLEKFTKERPVQTSNIASGRGKEAPARLNPATEHKAQPAKPATPDKSSPKNQPAPVPAPAPALKKQTSVVGTPPGLAPIKTKAEKAPAAPGPGAASSPPVKKTDAKPETPRSGPSSQKAAHKKLRRRALALALIRSRLDER